MTSHDVRKLKPRNYHIDFGVPNWTIASPRHGNGSRLVDDESRKNSVIFIERERERQNQFLKTQSIAKTLVNISCIYSLSGNHPSAENAGKFER